MVDSKPGTSDDSSSAHRRVGDKALRRHLRRAYRSELTRVWLPAVCLLTLLIGGMSVLLLRSQEQSRVELEQRYALRTALQSGFVASYVADIHKREAAQAAELLAGPAISTTRLALVSGAFGSSAAVLLDAQGRALSILPAKPELIGKRLDVKYAHLRAAVAGASAVSGVVPSAARSEPIVAFAVPFRTPFGRRVFSVGVAISAGPLRQFLTSSLPFKGDRAYLIDADDNLIVAGGSAEPGLALPPETHGTSGSVAVTGTRYRFVSEAVTGTPWRFLTLAPSSQLLAPLSGPKKWIPWVVLLAFVLASAAALWLLGKLMRRKAELSHLAAHDPLTGAVNRPALELAFHRLAFERRRSTSATGVLAIDLDHFKDVNDLYGHAAGDELLRHVVENLIAAVRPSDIVARIGGDEFVVLLADVDQQQADEVAERVVRKLGEVLFPVVGVVGLRAGCSIGIALAGRDDEIHSVLARADGALYEAKSVGRNGWRAALVT